MPGLSSLLWAYWPELAYDDGLRLQGGLARARAARAVPDVLLLLQHPPTVTLGRRAGREALVLSRPELARRGIACVHADRGGLATYHGPGQLVAYLLCALGPLGLGVREFVSRLEGAVVDVLAGNGLVSERGARGPGVWVGGAKIAAIGLRVRRGVTAHGLALNVCGDLAPFSYIRPCGQPGAPVTSVEQAAGRPASPRELARPLAAALARRLGLDPRRLPARVLAALAARWHDEGARRGLEAARWKWDNRPERWSSSP